MKQRNFSNHSKPNQAKNRFITPLGALAIIVAAACMFTGCQGKAKNEQKQEPGTNTSVSTNTSPNTISLYKDSLKLADGDIKSFNLHAKNGDAVDMRIYKMTDYLVAFQNVQKDNKHFGFSFYNIENEKEYVLENNDLGQNIQNMASLSTAFRKKTEGRTGVHDEANAFADKIAKNNTRKEDIKVEKIKDTISKVTYKEVWDDVIYTFFIDINDTTYLRIRLTCKPKAGCDLNSKEITGTLKIFENLQIRFVDEKGQPSDTNANSYTVDERFRYYFAFKDMDTKKFNKDLALKSINDYQGNKVTSLPITYQNLSASFKPYVIKKDRYVTQVVEASTVDRAEIHWGVSQDNQCLRTKFYEKDPKPIADAMANHSFYVEISKYRYDKQLGIDTSSKKKDVDIILENLGNPNEIYIHSEIEAAREKADYWLVYNYGDYMFAFRFTESSDKDRSKQSDKYIAPHFEEAYYIDGDSFKNGINAIKDKTFKNYYDSTIDLVVK